MIELWIVLTIIAALVQSVRYALQKDLSGELSTNAVTLTRFLFGLPFSSLYLVVLHFVTGASFPVLNADFLALATIGGVAQILGTAALIISFRFRNFAVGVTYSKTEALQVAILGVLVFGAAITPLAFLAIGISVAGVIVMSVPSRSDGGESLLRRMTGPAVLPGIGAGAGFAVAALCFREAALALAMPGYLEPAAITLVYVNLAQTITLGGYMWIREREQLQAIRGHLGRSILIGLTGAGGSAFWFTAMTLVNAAWVRTVGQVELVFSLIISWLVFRESTSRHELAGMAIVIAGIVMLVMNVN